MENVWYDGYNEGMVGRKARECVMSLFHLLSVFFFSTPLLRSEFPDAKIPQRSYMLRDGAAYGN